MTMLIVLTVLGVAWAVAILLVLALCRMAARADAVEIGTADQSPRRPSTWGTVRKRIFTSAQSDQLATYK
jgi:predicted secreted protein